MFGGSENLGGAVDADRVVGWRMHDQQRLVELCYMRRQAVFGDVVEKFALDVKRPPGELDLHLALRSNVIEAILEEMCDMHGIGGSGNRNDRLCLRYLPRGSEDRGATQAMADQDRGRRARFAQMIGGADEVGDVRGEGRVGEFALAGAEPRKVKPQHRDAFCGERRRDALGRQHILAAGEAMRK
jgi:hypothetical protein